MPCYSVRPNPPSCPEIELEAVDPGAVLHILSRRQWNGADVYEANEYAFSVRISDGGFWVIFQREVPLINHIEAFG